MRRWRLGDLVIRLGVIGLSEGNGHPLSFSAIVNGYDKAEFEAAGWPVILDYLEREGPDRFGFPETRVTDVWTQDRALTRTIARACRIENPRDRVEDMLGSVDAVLLARDDWRCHRPLAETFLKRDIPVFVDKPLSLDAGDLAYFKPFLESGLMMSTSGLRYAREIAALRERLPSLGTLKLLSATVVIDLERYGVHMLDAAAGLGLAKPVSVMRLPADHEAVSLTLEDGMTFDLHCLGLVAKTFHLSLFGEKGHAHTDINDNFAAFRNTIEHFLGMVRGGPPPIPANDVLHTMKLIGTACTLSPGESARLV